MDAPVSGEIFNVGSTEQLSILELAKRVIEAAKSESDFEFVPYEKVYNGGIEDMLHRIPSIQKIAAAIGWQPTRDLDVILNDVIRHTLGHEVRIDEPAAAR